MNKCVFCAYTCIYFLALTLKRAKKPDNPAEMSTCSNQILASNCHCPLRGTRAFREMPNPRDGQSRHKMNLNTLLCQKV